MTDVEFKAFYEKCEERVLFVTKKALKQTLGELPVRDAGLEKFWNKCSDRAMYAAKRAMQETYEEVLAEHFPE